MGDLIEITTWPKCPKTFYQNKSSATFFEVKGSHGAAIGLSRTPSAKCDLWIVLGDNYNRRSWIKKDDLTRETVITPGILSNEEYRKFCLRWDGGYVVVARVGDSKPILSYKYSKVDMHYITFSVISQSVSIDWKFELPPTRLKYQLKWVEGGAPTWVEGENELPVGALIGGYENENLYIIRGNHMGSLTPGKFVPSEGTGYISWGGSSHEMEVFQVLCGYNVIWVPTWKNRIPNGAIPGGHSEDNNERLYIGRALHEGHLIPGKVQPSHKCCYIPYNGREIAKNKFEILVNPEVDSRYIQEIKSISNDSDSGEEYYDGDDQDDDVDDDDGDDDEDDDMDNYPRRGSIIIFYFKHSSCEKGPATKKNQPYRV